MSRLFIGIGLVVLLVGCAPAAGCAYVVGVEVVEVGEGWRFDVTVASSDTGWEKYADRWEVRSPGGEVLGTRVLLHPHVEEQPFTRSTTVTIPDGIGEVEVVAHDSVEGFCGASMRLALP